MILVRNDWIKNWNPIHRGEKTFFEPCTMLWTCPIWDKKDQCGLIMVWQLEYYVHSNSNHNYWLVVGPSEKYESQLGWFFPIYDKNEKNIPKHQADNHNDVAEKRWNWYGWSPTSMDQYGSVRVRGSAGMPEDFGGMVNYHPNKWINIWIKNWNMVSMKILRVITVIFHLPFAECLWRMSISNVGL